MGVLERDQHASSAGKQSSNLGNVGRIYVLGHRAAGKLGPGALRTAVSVPLVNWRELRTP